MTPHFSILARLRSAWGNRSEPEEMHALLSIYWRALLSLALLICACALLFGAWELSAVIQSENAAPPASSLGNPPIDEKTLKAALNSFANRQAEYQELSQSPAPAIADPSK